jgi:Domain of unknown function (DUF4167)
VRQGQQNRRGRGRNRKSHNPLARSFESNGPDVKIRGTPAHIAEKYLSLARDAQSSGDPVLAENYLQHAEHYSRIIMAYRDQLQQPGDAANGNGQRLQHGEGADDFGDDEGDDMLDDGFQPMLHPQPSLQGRPYEGSRHENNRIEGVHRHDRPFRRDHQRFRDRNSERPMDTRPQPAPERQHDPVADPGVERRREKFQPTHEQPDFLRRPVRRVRSEGEPPAATPGKDDPSRE